MSSELPLNPEIRAEIINLTEDCLRNDITAEELARLEELVRGNPAALQEYLNYVVQSACLARWADGAQTTKENCAVPGLDIDEEYLQRLLSQPSQSSHAKTPPPATRRESSLGLRGLIQEFARQPLAVAILLLVMISGGVLIWQLATSLPPQPIAQQKTEQSPISNPKSQISSPAIHNPQSTIRNPIIARLKATRDATWDEPTWQPGTELHAGQRLVLKAGLAEIMFDSGATVVLEGPAKLEVGSQESGVGSQGSGVRSRESGVGGRESGVREQASGEPKSPIPNPKSQMVNSCSLSLGKLVARVPKQAHGFTVHTPTLTIVDLGTEFAVEVESRKSEVGMGNSESPTSELRPPTSTKVHVLQGEVSVQPAADALTQTPPVTPPSDLRPPTLLKAGEAVVSDPAAAAPRAIQVNVASFVRELPTERISATNPKRERGAEEPGASAHPLTAGDILAVSRYARKLVKIDPRSGKQTLLVQGERDIHGSDWMCVAVDQQRRILIGVDFGRGMIGGGVLRFDAGGNKLEVLAQGGILANGRVSGIAVAADGTIHATLDSDKDSIVSIDPRSGATRAVTSFGDNAWGICVDVGGRNLLAVSEGPAGAVARIQGGSIKEVISDPSLKGARGVAVTLDGRTFVTAGHGGPGSIVELDWQGRKVMPLASVPAGMGQDLAMLAAEADGNLIVGVYSPGGEVYRVDVAGKKCSVLASGGDLEQAGGVTVVPGGD